MAHSSYATTIRRRRAERRCIERRDRRAVAERAGYIEISNVGMSEGKVGNIF
jgi:hypothetical protein